ncbi:MAG: DNA recombination protein RmuC [Rhodospirillales bacterium]|nr:DNA recombination protein RmuC [Rhodospirillales bacterium]
MDVGVVSVAIVVLLVAVLVVLALLLGRLSQLGLGHAAAQGQLTKTLEDRLDAVSRRLNDGLTEQSRTTTTHLTALQERLAVIDAAQKNITELSTQVVGLQDILSNKQARGAFGEIQLKDLVEKALPPSAYEFQATLGNGKRADCVLKLAGPPGLIAVDAKFPLEGYAALRAAKSDAETTVAARAFAADLVKHLKDISERYIVAGETAEWAVMFLPSEAIYAELHTNFRAVIDESHRRRVAIVSPTTLWAVLFTIRSLLKDAKMREQAGLIQKEVEILLVDVRRVAERADNLEKHFSMAVKDVHELQISTDKVEKRAAKIGEVELDNPAVEEPTPAPQLKTGS